MMSFLLAYNSKCAFCLKDLDHDDCVVVNANESPIDLFPYAVHKDCFAKKIAEPKNEHSELIPGFDTLTSLPKLPYFEEHERV
jgi:hypothetical protein